MQFKIPKPNINALTLARQLGYYPLPNQSYARPVSGLNYPRFHLYVQEQNNELVFHLHLDQKKPSYAGATAHSGEYEGEVLEKELERIKKIIDKACSLC